MSLTKSKLIKVKRNDQNALVDILATNFLEVNITFSIFGSFLGQGALTAKSQL